MNLHLQEISKQVSEGAHAVVVADRAGWHSSSALDVPVNISLLPQPAYSPELNPVENIWEYLKKNHLAITVYDTYESILDRCQQAWNALMATPARIASIASRDWAKPVTA